jgi:hypothetical protein
MDREKLLEGAECTDCDNVNEDELPRLPLATLLFEIFGVSHVNSSCNVMRGALALARDGKSSAIFQPSGSGAKDDDRAEALLFGTFLVSVSSEPARSTICDRLRLTLLCRNSVP